MIQASRDAKPIDIVQTSKSAAFIALGIVSAGFGLKGFLLPSHLIDGGVTGVAMLLARLAGWPLWLSIPVMNLPFIAIGYWFLGRDFAEKTALAMTGLALCLAFVPYPDVTPDLLLTAVFGGGFIGAGIGLAIRGGAVLDGTEIVALLVASRSPLFKVSDVTLSLNILIFVIAMAFLGPEPALYSILTYAAASKAVHFFVYGIEEYTGVTIVSEHGDEIRRLVSEGLGRGVTVLRGKRGFGKRGDRNEEMDIVFTVVTRLELPKLRSEVARVDAAAFVVVHGVDDASGGMLKRRPLHP